MQSMDVSEEICSIKQELKDAWVAIRSLSDNPGKEDTKDQPNSSHVHCSDATQLSDEHGHAKSLRDMKKDIDILNRELGNQQYEYLNMREALEKRFDKMDNICHDFDVQLRRRPFGSYVEHSLGDIQHNSCNQKDLDIALHPRHDVPSTCAHENLESATGNQVLDMHQLMDIHRIQTDFESAARLESRIEQLSEYMMVRLSTFECCLENLKGMENVEERLALVKGLEARLKIQEDHVFELKAHINSQPLKSNESDTSACIKDIGDCLERVKDMEVRMVIHESRLSNINTQLQKMIRAQQGHPLMDMSFIKEMSVAKQHDVEQMSQANARLRSELKDFTSKQISDLHADLKKQLQEALQGHQRCHYELVEQKQSSAKLDDAKQDLNMRMSASILRDDVEGPLLPTLLVKEQKYVQFQKQPLWETRDCSALCTPSKSSPRCLVAERPDRSASSPRAASPHARR